jgi:putative nucleotidyltransferase with HDIG domain
MMEDYTLIDKSQIIAVINRMLLHVDERLVQHGERVAYIASRIIQGGACPEGVDFDKLIILSLLHDVGAYKTEEIDEMVTFDSDRVWSHSVYGYLFLKHISPMGEEAEAILYHHLKYSDYDKTSSRYLNYAGLIFLADRIDILSQTTQGDFHLIQEHSGTLFDPRYVQLFFDAHPERIYRALCDGSYRETLAGIVDRLSFTREETFAYLKMMVFSVDFRSEHTVTHTINTTAISNELGKRLGLDEAARKRLYLGALLHDVGKVAIDPRIVEYQGRLSPEKMETMRGHVLFTRQIISGVVSDEVVEIAARHHEKLDGSGYPEGLREEDLTLSQQIVAVSDIVSALTRKRSYKDAYPKEKTLTILRQMQAEGKLDASICREMMEHYDEIMAVTDSSRNPIIQMYDDLHREYFQLNDRIQSSLPR